MDASSPLASRTAYNCCMTDQLKVGDVVQLKSGGPVMTIQSITDSFAFCVWFEEKKIKRESGSFELKSLQPA